ncbi:dysbindin domain-containing protein 1-like [Scleropages formosus]|uniref:Dysbindin domain-containing protein 1 n=1 Tax=Scleropages formosus TaxID=113540 RepID=A0A8C9SGJ1_SCLFO|nr:dysbindin domain-containing protein 1-like [Scleropages formosus]
MEARGGAGSPEPNKDAQKLRRPSSSGEVNTEPSHNASGGAERGFPVPISGLLQVAERRQPLSSVSSLEVHFDLLDLTELTDMSDQELTEVFVDSDEEHHNELAASCPTDAPALQPHGDSRLSGHHHPPQPRGGYLRSPSWSRCSRGDAGRERKRQSESDTREPFPRAERPKQP